MLHTRTSPFNVGSDAVLGDDLIRMTQGPGGEETTVPFPIPVVDPVVTELRALRADVYTLRQDLYWRSFEGRAIRLWRWISQLFSR